MREKSRCYCNSGHRQKQFSGQILLRGGAGFSHRIFQRVGGSVGLINALTAFYSCILISREPVPLSVCINVYSSVSIMQA
jgi:hypothetical protein